LQVGGHPKVLRGRRAHSLSRPFKLGRVDEVTPTRNSVSLIR
jgi:hypothetical protein